MDELYLYNISGAFAYLEFDTSYMIIKNKSETQKSIVISNGSYLYDKLTVKSFINLKSTITKLDKTEDFQAIKLDFKIATDEDETFHGVIVKKNKSCYSLILLPNEQVLSELIKEFEKNLVERKDYTDEIFHDIKTRLSNVVMDLNDLKKKSDIEISRCQEFLKLKDSIDDLLKLVEDLLYFVEIDKNFSKNKCRWGDILYRSVRNCSSIWEKYPNSNLILEINNDGHLIFSEHPQKLAPQILEIISKNSFCNELYMIRAISNLIEDSIKYSREKEKPKIVISIKADEKPLLIIADNGCGIRKADINRIRKRGERGSNALVGNTPGHGMGLAIADKIFGKHNFTLTIESKEDKFTEMRIWG